MKRLIIGNWKMNPSSLEEAKKLFVEVKNGTRGLKNVETVMCPPFVYLPLFKGLNLGAQNTFYEEKGAFTGEISPLMLKNLGIKYVILGHSERRKVFGEIDEKINKKIKRALASRLKVIFCVGENKEEWEKGKKSEVLTEQIKKGLSGVTGKEIKDIVIAYEPVFAIGTGNNCSVDETMSSILQIRKIIFNLYNRQAADNIKIIYGGSVKSDNSGQYIKDARVDGLLVGGASLDKKEFIKIAKSAN